MGIHWEISSCWECWISFSLLNTDCGKDSGDSSTGWFTNMQCWSKVWIREAQTHLSHSPAPLSWLKEAVPSQTVAMADRPQGFQPLALAASKRGWPLRYTCRIPVFRNRCCRWDFSRTELHWWKLIGYVELITITAQMAVPKLVSRNSPALADL